jgi:hypothetical protein
MPPSLNQQDQKSLQTHKTHKSQITTNPQNRNQKSEITTNPQNPQIRNHYKPTKPTKQKSLQTHKTEIKNH